MIKKVGFVFLMVFLICFVSADHEITPGSVNVDEDVLSGFDLSIQNTGSYDITQIRVRLPGSFSFETGSEGSDVGIYSFQQSGDDLLWSNSSSLIGVGETKQFSFEATASTSGEYNLVVTSSHGTEAYSSNFVVRVNDATPPVVSFGDSPKNEAVVTSDKVTFKMKCADDSDLVVIELWGNWSGEWQMEDVNRTPVDGQIWSETIPNFENGFYKWSVYCRDSDGNEGWTDANRTFEVDFHTDSLGSPAVGNYLIDESDLAKGYKNKLKIGTRIRFNYLGELHYVQVRGMTGSSVNVEVASEPIITDIVVNETKNFELNGDDYYDLSVKLIGITIVGTTGNAEILIKKINEKIPQENYSVQNDSLENSTVENSSPIINNSEEVGEEGEPFNWNLLFIVAGGVVFVLVVGFVIFSLMNRKPKVNEVQKEKEKPSGTYVMEETDSFSDEDS